MITIQQVPVEFLKKLQGKSVMLYFSSCNFREEIVDLPFDYIILNNKEINDQYHKPGLMQLIAEKVITLGYDNEKTLRILINACVKIKCVVGIQDGCEEGGNHECVNSYNFFSRLSAIVPEEFLYITNHYFVKGNPLKRSVPFNFLKQKPEILGFDPLLLSEYCQDPANLFIFKVEKTDPHTISYFVGRIEVIIHHLSIWDMANGLDGLIIPEYPVMVKDNFIDMQIMQKCMLQQSGLEEMLPWALENRYETIGSIPLSSDQVMVNIVLDKIEKWSESYPKTIHFFHLLKADLATFRNTIISNHTRRSLSISDKEQRFTQLSNDIREGKGNPMDIVLNMIRYEAKAFDPLVAGLASPSAEMRMYVIDGLAKISRKKALKVLIPILGNLGMEEHWRYIVRLIAEGFVSIDWKIIYSALHDPNPVLRKNILQLLRQIDNDDTINELFSLLNDPDDDVFTMACSNINEYAVMNILTRSSNPELIKILQGSNPVRRIGAANALSAMGNLEAVQPLFKMIELFPDDRSLHIAVGSALAEIYTEYKNEDLRVVIDSLLENNLFLGSFILKLKRGIIREDDEDFYSVK